MLSCSVTRRPEQEFDVAVAAFDRGGDYRRARAIRARRQIRRYRRRPQHGCAGSRTMPFLHGAAPTSNCGLISATSWAGVLASAIAGGSTNLSEMKLTSMVTKSGRFIEPAGGKGANVGGLERNNLGPGTQCLVQLAATDIDRIDASRATVQQHLRKSAGRGADIEADATLRIEVESDRAPPRA